MAKLKKMKSLSLCVLKITYRADIQTFLLFQKQPPRQFSKISVLFFQEQPFYNFPGGSICSSNRHEFSRRLIEKTCFFKEDLSVCRTDLFISSNTYEFSRSLYFVIEHLQFSRRPYLVLEHIPIFQETPMPRTHRHFPGRYPISNRYFVNRSRWLLSLFKCYKNSLEYIYGMFLFFIIIYNLFEERTIKRCYKVFVLFCCFLCNRAAICYVKNLFFGFRHKNAFSKQRFEAGDKMVKQVKQYNIYHSY